MRKFAICAILSFIMTILGVRKISYTFSGVLVGLSIVAIAIFGLRMGIDFTGGSILEIKYITVRPAHQEILNALVAAGIPNAIVQPTGEREVLIRMRALSEAEHQQVLSALSSLSELSEKRFDSIGPTIGGELRRKALWAIALSVTMIILYISWAFRHVSRPMASWKYGVTAIIALAHDVLIPIGTFAALGHYYGVEVDTLFLTALLTVFGFSVHDTIVVFDRIRENLRKHGSTRSFEEVVEESVASTIGRSINTSLTVIFVMVVLYVFGGASTKLFALAVLIGITAGTYSSIFIASALLVSWHNYSLRRA